MLHDADLETVALLAAASQEDVENILCAATAFASKRGEGARSKSVFITGRPALTELECAEVMVQEARRVMQRDLGLGAGAWQGQGGQGARRRSKEATGGRRRSKEAPGKRSSEGVSRVSPGGQRRSGINQEVDPVLQHLKELGVGKVQLVEQERVVAVKGEKVEVLGQKEALSTLVVGKKSGEVEVPAADKIADVPSGESNCEEEQRSKEESAVGGGATSSNEEQAYVKIKVILAPKDSAKTDQEVADETKHVEINTDKSKSNEEVTLKPRIPSSTSLINMSFDMSSIVENIFFAEEEGMAEESSTRSGGKRKRVSWGDEEQGQLISTTILSQPMFDSEEEVEMEEQQVDQEAGQEELSTPEGSYNPTTPNFPVCSEELDLHWSDSGGEQEEVFLQDEVHEKKVKEPQDQEDVFLDQDTMAGSFLDQAMGEDRVSEKVSEPEARPDAESEPSPDHGVEAEVSLGCLAAAGGLDTLASQFSPELTISRNLKRRRATTKKSKRLRASKSPGVILSDSEAEVEAPSPGPEVQPVSQLASHLPDFSIVDVCSSRQLFTTFLEEWSGRSSYSLAVAVRKGGGCPELEVEAGEVTGLAVSWSSLDSYYVSLGPGEGDPDDSLCAGTQDSDLGLDERLAGVAKVLRSSVGEVTALQYRHHASLLYSVTGAFLRPKVRDPAVAAWLLQPSAPPPTLARLVLEQASRLLPLLSTLGSGPGHGSVAANPGSRAPPRHRAAAEAVLVRHVMEGLEGELEREGLREHFHGVEMGAEVVLAGMEQAGMGLCEEECQDVTLLLQARTKILEDQAYREAGRHFNLNSPPEVCKVLYHELRLPVNGDPKLTLKSVRPGKFGVKLSSTKEVLERLVARGHRLPGLVLEHRRLGHALGSTVAPLLAKAVLHPGQGTPKIYPTAVTHTATGRVTMHEPNLQNVPRDFEVMLLILTSLTNEPLRYRSPRSSGTPPWVVGAEGGKDTTAPAWLSAPLLASWVRPMSAPPPSPCAGLWCLPRATSCSRPTTRSLSCGYWPTSRGTRGWWPLCGRVGTSSRTLLGNFMAAPKLR